MPEINLPQHKMYYSIGEVAELFAVNASLIRFWEKEFTIINPTKDKKGNRKFTPSDIEKFQLIYHLVKERKFTLEGAKAKLVSGITDEMDKMEAIQKLVKIKEELLLLKSRIRD